MAPNLKQRPEPTIKNFHDLFRSDVYNPMMRAVMDTIEEFKEREDDPRDFGATFTLRVIQNYQSQK